MSPFKLQVECTLYHGCEVLTSSVLSDEVYFGNNPRFDQWITFGNLRVSSLREVMVLVLPDPNEDPTEF